MMYKAKVAVCSEIQTKHINTPCGQNVELLNVTPGGTVLKETARLQKVKTMSSLLHAACFGPPSGFI
jgi:hypothetical protein